MDTFRVHDLLGVGVIRGAAPAGTGPSGREKRRSRVVLNCDVGRKARGPLPQYILIELP